MKRIATIIMLSLGLVLNAQVNKNVTKETTTTKVTVNDGSTPRTVTKTENTESTQRIELKDAESRKLNKDVKQTPVQVTSTTTVAKDGKPVQQTSTSYYEMNGQRYMFVSDKMGYRISSADNKDYGILRKTSNNNYIYHSKDRTSIGYFDAEGNFIIESYDDKTDNITVETYTRTRQ